MKLIVNFISKFEKRISLATSRRKLNGVICGHIHHAEIRQIGNIEYFNCGDWVESCTALVENLNVVRLIKKKVKNLKKKIFLNTQ